MISKVKKIFRKMFIVADLVSLTERLLMEHKESNQTNKTKVIIEKNVLYFFLVLENSESPDEIPQKVDIPCLPKYPFWGFQSSNINHYWV